MAQTVQATRLVGTGHVLPNVTGEHPRIALTAQDRARQRAKLWREHCFVIQRTEHAQQVLRAGIIIAPG